jgi:cellobiose phosphorylase
MSGLAVSPSVPAEWAGFTMRKVFRGKTLRITVDNTARHEGGVTRLVLNGKERLPGLIRDDELSEVNDLLVVM